MDTLTPEQRHKNMAAIRSKDTKPEMIVRRELWKRGFRYRLNCKSLPGHPDLVLRKYRTCIFVNGCFWHGHNVALSENNHGLSGIKNSVCCKIPKTNREFWVEKIRRNKERDSKVRRELTAMGWHCVTIWECELKPSKREAVLRSLESAVNKLWLKNHAVGGKAYPKREEDGMLMAAEERESTNK